MKEASVSFFWSLQQVPAVVLKPTPQPSTSIGAVMKSCENNMFSTFRDICQKISNVGGYTQKTTILQSFLLKVILALKRLIRQNLAVSLKFKIGVQASCIASVPNLFSLRS